MDTERMIERYHSLPPEQADRYLERMGNAGETLSLMGRLATFGGVFSVLMTFYLLDSAHDWILWCVCTLVFFVLFLLTVRLSTEFMETYNRLCQEKHSGTCRI